MAGSKSAYPGNCRKTATQYEIRAIFAARRAALWTLVCSTVRACFNDVCCEDCPRVPNCNGPNRHSTVLYLAGARVIVQASRAQFLKASDGSNVREWPGAYVQVRLAGCRAQSEHPAETSSEPLIYRCSKLPCLTAGPTIGHAYRQTLAGKIP